MIDSGRHTTQMPSTQEPTEQNRATLIETLHQEYKRQMEQPFQGATMAAVGQKESTDVIRSSLPLVLHRSSSAVEESHPSSSSIIQVYEDVGQRLLILGEAGAGKTTLLLELADKLLMRAEDDLTLPIPVILNLCSWAGKTSPLESWLIDQLQLVYHVPSRLSRAWLDQNGWLLMLDGLDEVEEALRSSCIEAINNYRAEDHSTPLVVCSRSHEYLAQESQLTFLNTVVVQPLQDGQVTEYLDQLGESVAGIYEAVRSNASLRQLVTTPLMLQVIVLAYRDETNVDLNQSSSPEELQLQILDRYAKRMLEQRSAGEQFTPQQTRHWLGWLAQQMKARHLTEFYLEWLQPSWLMTGRAQIQYRLLYILIYGLVGGLIYGLVGGLVYGLMGKLTYGLIGGLTLGLVVGMVGGSLDDIKSIRPVEVLTWSWKGVWREPFAGAHDEKKFHLREVLTWSMNSLWQGLIIGILVGLTSWLMMGLILAVIVGLIGALIGWLIVDLVGGLMAKVVCELINGVSGEQISKDIHIKPNQAIRDSGSKALCLGLVGGLVVGLIVGLLGARVLGLEQGLVLGVFLGVFLGVLIAQIFGGRTYVCHYLLRYILYRDNVMPWHYVRFLEEATRHNLLQRVAGGYRFTHPLLIDHFASQSKNTSFNAVDQALQLLPQGQQML